MYSTDSDEEKINDGEIGLMKEISEDQMAFECVT